jgi:3-(3-hydroxy-phenyl)propionate hydroxylase
VTAALMLAQRGTRTVVLEKRPAMYPLPRAVHLDDEVYRILADVGVAEQFGKITMPTQGLRLVDAKHRSMAEFRRSDPLGAFGYPPANMFDQPDLEQILRAHLAQQKRATLRSGTKVVSLNPQPSGQVEIHTRDDDGTESVILADAVLGCDGANSTVRAQIGATLEDLGFEERWLVVDVRCATVLPLWQGVHQLCDPQRAGTYMQVGPDRYRWEFRLKDDETVESVIESGLLEQLLEPWLGGAVAYSDLELLRHAEYTFKARLADRWRDGSVFLLGDAAHLTPPFIGQGLCAGLRDAANLTWKLSDVLAGRADRVLLETYETERKPHARSLVKKAVRVGWAMTGGQDGAAHVRRIALAIAVRIPGVTEKVIDGQPPKFPDGPAISRAGRRDRITGGLLPQPWVETQSGRVRLDDVTGPGYSVLVVGEPDNRLLTSAQDFGARVVHLLPAGRQPAQHPGYTAAVDDEGTLLDWFRASRTAAVLVRPDHVVQSREPVGRTAHATGAHLAEYLRVWAAQMRWATEPMEVAR